MIIFIAEITFLGIAGTFIFGFLYFFHCLDKMEKQREEKD